MTQAMNVLFFDIETAPMSGYMWRPKTEYVPHGQRIEDSYMLTWSAKWRGKGPGTAMETNWLNPAEVVERDDSRLVESLAHMVRQADIVVAHNARRFDVPRLNGRLMQLRLEPLTPFRVIDTLEIARKSFDLPYYRLDYLAQILLGRGKFETDFELWRSIVERQDERSMRRMVRYNAEDVRLLEGVFDYTLPYAKGLPRMVRAGFDGEFACPYCGSYDVMKRGFHDTNAQTWQTWQCLKCERYSRERTNDRKRLALVPIP